MSEKTRRVVIDPDSGRLAVDDHSIVNLCLSFYVQNGLVTSHREKAKALLDRVKIEEIKDERSYEGERTGAYVPLPKINLHCTGCGKICRAIAHNTGDGWLLGLDCECQDVNDDVYFDWPKGNESFNAKDLRALGFEIV